MKDKSFNLKTRDKKTQELVRYSLIPFNLKTRANKKMQKVKKKIHYLNLLYKHWKGMSKLYSKEIDLNSKKRAISYKKYERNILYNLKDEMNPDKYKKKIRKVDSGKEKLEHEYYEMCDEINNLISYVINTETKIEKMKNFS